MASLLNSPMMAVVGQWLEKIKLAQQFKNRRFGPDAAEGMKFFCGPYDWLYNRDGRSKDKHFRERADEESDGEIPEPKFQMTVNKVAELVQIFGPALYHKNPVRTVTPREVPLPDQELMAALGPDPAAGMMLQQLMQQAMMARGIDATRAKLMSYYLNYTPDALDLKTESRWAIDEALIKGMGCLWSEPYTTPAGMKLVGSFYDSVDNLVIDPDMPTLRAAKWIARRRVEPVWEAERKFNLPPGTLRGQMESQNRQGEVNSAPDGDYMRKQGATNDLIVYWEIFSKTGVGGRLTGSDGAFNEIWEALGDFCYLVVAEGHEFPLNVPPQVWDLEGSQAMGQIQAMVQWHTPLWADDAWPMTPFQFHTVPGDPWPMSHIAPGMGELKFLNWAYSILAGKLRISCRDFIAILEEAGQEIKDKILHGADYEWIPLKGSNGKSIQEMVQFLQHPPFNGDIWRVIDVIAEQFERRVGLTELMYGLSSVQLRSAAEAEAKQSQTSIRPDDMANKVEDAMSEVARKEAIIVAWHLRGQDVQMVMGPVGMMLWDRFITPANPTEIMYSLEYRIEAGSVRKPNRDKDAANLRDATQLLLPFFQTVAAQGFPGPFNTLVEQWGKTIDFKTEGLMLPQPQAPNPEAPPTKPAG